MATATKEQGKTATKPKAAAAPIATPEKRNMTPAGPPLPSEILHDPRKLKAATLLGEGALMDHTLQQVAEMVGITDRTLLTWRNTPAFQDAVIIIARKQLKDAMPTAYKSLLQLAKDSDHKIRLRAIELLFKAGGELIERMEVSNPKAEARSILAALDAEMKTIEQGG